MGHDRPRGHYAFQTIITTNFLHNSFEDGWAAAIEQAKGIYEEIEDGHILVKEADLPQDFADGVFCEGCEGGAIPGVRWPSTVNGDDTHSWVERCDSCEQYDSDFDAQKAVLAFYEGADAVEQYGAAKPHGSQTLTPYVEVP